MIDIKTDAQAEMFIEALNAKIDEYSKSPYSSQKDRACGMLEALLLAKEFFEISA